jgi:membrane peptidoglycan carboxypeptidase
MQGIQDAFAESALKGEVVRGGSTITQQLAKNLFLDGRQTLRRKLREFLLAIELDRVLGKDGVLELYLNIVEWGPDFFGIAAASERYFMKRPHALNPREAAFLSVVLPAPRTYYRDWYLTGRGAQLRVDWVLDNMAASGALTREQSAFWKDELIAFVPPPIDGASAR